MNKRARTEVISSSCKKLLVIIFHDKKNEMNMSLTDRVKIESEKDDLGFRR